MAELRKTYVEPYRVEETFSSLHGFHSSDYRQFLETLLDQSDSSNTFVLDVPYRVSTKLRISQAINILEELGVSPKEITITKGSFPFGKHTMQIIF
ncbi:MAG: hypothetical protein HFJ54_05015 [Clostridia bacterium]|nr:hypothetical protein [Clostridia bacterium]